MFDELLYLINPRRGYSHADILLLNEMIQDFDLAIRQFGENNAVAHACCTLLDFRLQNRDVKKFMNILEENYDELFQEVTRTLANEG